MIPSLPFYYPLPKLQRLEPSNRGALREQETEKEDPKSQERYSKARSGLKVTGGGGGSVESPQLGACVCTPISLGTYDLLAL